MEFRAYDAVAMLAGMGALEAAHQRERLLGDRPHGDDILFEAQVENRPHMQPADRRMGVPGAAGPTLLENIGQPGGVFGEMLERNRTILHEGDRLCGVAVWR